MMQMPRLAKARKKEVHLTRGWAPVRSPVCPSSMNCYVSLSGALLDCCARNELFGVNRRSRGLAPDRSCLEEASASVVCGGTERMLFGVEGGHYAFARA